MKDNLRISRQAILWAILLGGAAAGVADIISAFGTQKGRVLGVLQYIGSGLIGSSAFDGGWATAAVGLATVSHVHPQTRLSPALGGAVVGLTSVTLHQLNRR